MNPHDLLKHAESIALSDPADLTQSILRRAVSTAYYAIFHLLTESGGAKLSTHAAVRQTLARKFDHGRMVKASDSVIKEALKEPLKSLIGSIPAELAIVASTFKEMQSHRHKADYDTRSSSNFTLLQTIQIAQQVRTAFEEWDKIKDTVAGEAYVLSMLIEFPDR